MTPIRRLLIAVALGLAFPSLAAPPDATLCVENAPCVRVDGAAARVDPSAVRRRFTWFDRPEGLLVVGAIAAQHDRVDRRIETGFDLKLSGPPDRWPAETTVTVRRDDDEWRTVIPPRGVPRVLRVRLAPGPYEVVVNAAGHVPNRVRLQASAATPAHAAVLAPMPRITGRVVTRKKREPIAGAAITVDGQVVAVADGGGEFSFDADPETWPAKVTVSAGGFGTAVIPLPAARADTALLDIELTAGATVRVSVVRSPLDDTPLRVSLFRRDNDVPAASAVAVRNLAGSEAAAEFQGVAEGEYVLVIEGKQPTERLGRKLTVAGGELTAVEVTLRPMTLAVRTELGGAALPDAKLEIHSWDGLWKASATTDGRGEAELPVWQAGRMSAVVFAPPALSTPHLEQATLEADERIEWVVSASSREVRGRVVDAATGAPIAAANVALRTPAATLSGRTDDAGGFRFSAVRAGKHMLMAAADGYLPKELPFVFDASDAERELTLRLRPVASRRVLVLDASGRPVAGAAVLDYVGPTLMGQRMTDAVGSVALPIGKGDVRTVFAVGRDGSFAITTIEGADRDEREATIRLPAARATLSIRTTTTGDESVRNVQVLMRYDGVVIPPDVQQMLGRLHGSELSSGTTGVITLRQLPLGLYEFWPVGSVAEMRELTMGLGADAAVKLFLQPGVNRAVMTFARK